MGDRQSLKKLYYFFLNCLSFNTPEAIVFNISLILIILAILPVSDLSYLPVRCVFKYFLLPIVFKGSCPSSGLFFECNCPFCGVTRGMNRFLHGDIKEAMKFNIIVIPLFFAMIIVLIINLVKVIRKHK